MWLEFRRVLFRSQVHAVGLPLVEERFVAGGFNRERGGAPSIERLRRWRGGDPCGDDSYPETLLIEQIEFGVWQSMVKHGELIHDPRERAALGCRSTAALSVASEKRNAAPSFIGMDNRVGSRELAVGIVKV